MGEKPGSSNLTIKILISANDLKERGRIVIG